MSDPVSTLTASRINDADTRFHRVQPLSRAQMETILDSLADGVTVIDAASQLIYCNDAAARLIGYADAHTLLLRRSEEVVRQFEIFDEAGRPLSHQQLPSQLALRGADSPPQVLRYRVRATGAEYWSVVTARLVRNEAGEAALVVSVFHDITDLKRREQQLHLLVQASKVLTAPLDFETRLKNVAQVIVPDFADWCALDILDAAGTLQRLTVRHVDPAKVQLALELHRRYPPRRDIPGGLYDVVRSGQSQFLPEVTELYLEATIVDREQLALARQLQIRSAMVVPLIARERVLGVLSFVAAESGRHYTPGDLALAEELAGRTALALDNAWLYGEAQRVNTELEQRITTRTAELETANNRLRDEIDERRQIQAQIYALNAELEKRVAERTKQLEQLNRNLHKEINERQQASKTLRGALRRTRELYRISQTIGSVRTPDEVLAALLLSSYLTSVSRASIAIFTEPFRVEQPPLCEMFAAWNKEAGLPDFVGELLTCQEVGLLPPYHFDKPIVIEDITARKEFPEYVRHRFETLGTRNLILLPLKARGVWYGMLSLHFHWRRTIKVDDLRHIRGLVDQAAIAIDNMRLMAAEAKARAEAEQANELKMKFLAMISHELRTPLTSIKGFATTLLADDVLWLPANQQDFLRTIDEETDKLSDLIEQLLDLSRLEAGALRIAPKTQALERVIETVLPQLRVLTAQHELIWQVPDDLPGVWVDADRIGQVLTNLVGNAARYSPVRTTITISAQRFDGMIQVDVADQGPGIPEEARTRIFEPFEQVERPPSRREGGAGLGLAICRGLVEAHGGRIWVQDHVGSGAIISFALPIAKEHTP